MVTTTELPPVTYIRTAEDGTFETATLSLTGFENRLAEAAAEHGISWGRSKIRRFAHRLCKEQAVFWDEDFERIFMHADPTPAQAIKNIEREGAQQP